MHGNIGQQPATRIPAQALSQQGGTAGSDTPAMRKVASQADPRTKQYIDG